MKPGLFMLHSLRKRNMGSLIFSPRLAPCSSSSSRSLSSVASSNRCRLPCHLKPLSVVPRNGAAVINIAASDDRKAGLTPERELDQRQPVQRRPKSRRALTFSPLLALASIAAAAVLKRPRGSSKHRAMASGSVALSGDLAPAQALRRIDAHLHVWASSDEAKSFPYFKGQEPTIPGSAELLIQNMDDAQVHGALIVQPINHKFDHSYIASVLQRFPGRFAGCCLADPSPGGGGVNELERLVKVGRTRPLPSTPMKVWSLPARCPPDACTSDPGSQDKFCAARFNPALWPAGNKMSDHIGKALFAKAGELHIPVGFMCFEGLLKSIDDIEELCSQFPATKVIMDHFGFCKPPISHEEWIAWERLLALSRFPQVYVKASAFFRVSREAYPYKDTWPHLRMLVDQFGVQRIMWGSDFPYIVEQCGYSPSWHILPETAVEDNVLSDDEKWWIMGGTASSLFEGSWV